MKFNAFSGIQESGSVGCCVICNRGFTDLKTREIKVNTQIDKHGDLSNKIIRKPMAINSRS